MNHLYKKTYLKELTLSKARMKFKIRTSMVDVKFNYKNDKRHMSDLWKCDSCLSAIESQNHVLHCPAYAELRNGKNINDDNDLTEYFRKVLQLREKLQISK